MRNTTARLRRRLVFAGLSLAVIAGCASPPRIDAVAEGPSFDRTGRFALLVEHQRGERDAVQGGFAWRDTQGQQWLDLANPLGSTLARIEVRLGRAILTRSDGTTDTAPHADALVEQVLGSPIPVDGLRDWLRGRLAPGSAEQVRRGADDHLERFTQNGWQVELSRYDELGPRLLRLRRAEAGRDISLRLVIDGQ